MGRKEKRSSVQYEHIILSSRRGRHDVAQCPGVRLYSVKMGERISLFLSLLLLVSALTPSLPVSPSLLSLEAPFHCQSPSVVYSCREMSHFAALNSPQYIFNLVFVQIGVIIIHKSMLGIQRRIIHIFPPVSFAE